jgi:hypothetical protein
MILYGRTKTQTSKPCISFLRRGVHPKQIEENPKVQKFLVMK